MEQRVTTIREPQNKTQELFIDGLKVTVRYGTGSNPAAVKKIRKPYWLAEGQNKRTDFVAFFALFPEILYNNGVEMAP